MSVNDKGIVDTLEGVSGERIQNADDEVSGTGLLAYTPIGGFA